MAKHASSNDARVPGWVWLVTGVALGALITLLMRLSELQPAKPAPAPANTKVNNEAEDVTFNFYKLLRDNEIVVDERKTPTTPAEDKDVEYLLQVASFRTLEDAEQARAELTLLNLVARVEKADVGQGQTWHRLIVGPFNSRSELAKARSTLLSNRFEALVLKRKKAG